MVDAHDSKSCLARGESSSLSSGTCKKKKTYCYIGGQRQVAKAILAIALAKKINGEIISADSRQVYKGLDIGTGKITKKK